MTLLAQVTPPAPTPPTAAPTPSETLLKSIETFSEGIIAYGLVLIAVATVTVALLELLKALTSARLVFHRQAVLDWTARGEPAPPRVAFFPLVGAILRHAFRGRHDGPASPAYTQLITLAAGSPESDAALFDQGTDKMMGQFQAASNLTLEFPAQYPELYEFLTGVPPAAPPAAEASAEQDRDVWRSFAGLMEKDPAAAKAAVETGDPRSIAATRSRARLDHLVARRLDAFQTALEYRWARLNQSVAVVGGAIFLYVVLHIQAGDQAGAFIPRNITLAVFGGMIAPFAKDLVVALQNLRRS